MLDAARICLLVAAASLPISTAATNAFAVLALLCWALSGQWVFTLHAVAAEPTAWLGCVLFAALALGITWSIASPAEAGGVLLKYRGLLLFGITMFLFADARWRERLLSAFLVGALVLLVLSYSVWLGLLHYVDARGFSSPQNAVLLKNAITHGFLMSLLAYGTAVFALRSSGGRRWAFALIAALAAANVWFAVQGRTGYVVMAVLFLWLAYSRWSVKGLVTAALGLGMVLGAAYKWAPVFHERINDAAEEARDYHQMKHPGETSIGSRFHFWKRSAEWMTKHPLLGAGTGGWGEAFYQATEGDDAFMHNRERDHPHNEYVHLAVQLGPLGLGLLVALLATAIVRAARLPDEYAALAQGFFIAFAVGALFNDMLRDTTENHLWAVLGGGLFGASRALPRGPA
ncbi:MAG: O-antigen ligase family protein [Burkholderiales bacterium]